MITLRPINLTEADKVRFWEKVARRGPDECWEWTEGRGKGGYGIFHDCYVAYYAHRIAFVVTYGDTELRVLHDCNHPWCCNPAHLYAGTQRQNIQQCHAEGRAADHRGEKHGYSKLTEDDVREIRRLYAGGRFHREIAEEYGIALSHVSRICNRKSWKHI